MNYRPVRLIAMMSVLALGWFLYGSLMHNEPAHALTSPTTTQGWSVQNVDGKVTFSYPSDFISVNDGGPDLLEVGGALLNHANSYQLLLGVAIDSHPHSTVSTVQTQLINSYKADSLLLNHSTPYGKELSFAMPDNMTYTVYLSPLPTGVREIIVNNEQSNPRFTDTIAAFLATVHNVTN